ncbi:MAG: molybdenum cofactor biosynthesis protein MoaE [Chitinophagaceae bacterium]
MEVAQHQIQITSQAISPGICLDWVNSPENGGINVFIGTVRNRTRDKPVIGLEFEAYEPMALMEMEKIALAAIRQWPVQKVLIHHRTGWLIPGEIAVVIAVGAAHREAAFEACRYIIETLKQRVPIWKKEVFEDGAFWVAAHP